MLVQRNAIANLIRRIVLVWLLAVTVEVLLLPSALRDLSGLEGLPNMSAVRMAVIALGILILLTVLTKFADTAACERWGILGCFVILSAICLTESFTWPFFAVCCLIGLVLFGFAVLGWNQKPLSESEPQKNRKVWCWITVALAVLFFLFVSAWGVCRVLSFSAPTYDFGIFSQMFYNMKTSGLPMTTVERDGLLSHFAVHVSPIYYLMLPFYCLVPTPATLQVLQAAVLASAVIPLWKLTGHHRLSGPTRVLCCAILLLYPAYSGGTSYDLHENCFLTPLILWLLYGIDRRNTPITVIAAMLTLLVKEDAAVYVAVAALWLLLRTALRREKSKWDLWAGYGILAASLLWFFAVTGYLAHSGDGVMTYRYRNFMYDGSSSLITVVKAVLRNPLKAVYECVDKEKLPFIGLSLLPLLGIPLLTRRYERYFLLIPYLLVNLMSDYSYQHDIFFQYTFGSTAFLIYLTVVNTADLKQNWRRLLVLLTAAAVCAGCFYGHVVPKATQYMKKTAKYSQRNASIRSALDQIPEEAAVTAATFYTVYLSEREELYDVRYCTAEHLLASEYVVLEPDRTGDFKKYTEDGENGYENLCLLLAENGYSLQDTVEDTIVIYAKK